MRAWGRWVLLLSLTTMWGGPVDGADWLQWRGPFFNGSTDEQDVPASWSKTENVAWVSPLPGPSGATPVIANGRVFVSSTVKGKPDFVALCFDAGTGKELWRKAVGSNPRKFPNNNMASPSPVTDGRRVFFLYGDGTLVGFDVEGKELWSRSIEKDYGNLALQFGYSSSPVLYGGKLFITVIRRDKPYRDPPAEGPLDSLILALDPATGKTVWKQVRKTNAFDEGMETYSTLLPWAREGRVELLTTGGDFVTAHDPGTGKELWRVEFWTQKVRDSRVIPSLVAGAGLVFGTQHKGYGVFAVEPPTTGDAARLLWKLDEPGTDCSTPLYYDGRLYVLDGLGKKTVTCLDPKTGRSYWRGKLTGSEPWWASPTAAAGRIYCINEAGRIAVLQAGGDAFRVLMQTQIEERPIRSSIAIAGGHLFLRTAENLYCIGK